MKKTKDLVQALLAEEGELTPEQQALRASKGLNTAPDPLPGADAAIDADEDEVEEEDPEVAMEETLVELLTDAGFRVQTFEHAGILTRNRGVVARGPQGKFQISIVEDRRGY